MTIRVSPYISTSVGVFSKKKEITDSEEIINMFKSDENELRILKVKSSIDKRNSEYDIDIMPTLQILIEVSPVDNDDIKRLMVSINEVLEGTDKETEINPKLIEQFVKAPESIMGMMIAIYNEIDKHGIAKITKMIYREKLHIIDLYMIRKKDFIYFKNDEIQFNEEIVKELSNRHQYEYLRVLKESLEYSSAELEMADVVKTSIPIGNTEEFKVALIEKKTGVVKVIGGNKIKILSDITKIIEPDETLINAILDQENSINKYKDYVVITGAENYIWDEIKRL